MHRFTHLGWVAVLTFAAGPVWAATECTQDDLTRTISVVYSSPGQPLPCEVLYEKPDEGQTMTLWRARNEAGYCEARAAEFINKLVDLGWACSAAEAEAGLSEPTKEEPVSG